MLGGCWSTVQSSLSNQDNLISMSAYRGGEGRVHTGGEGRDHTGGEVRDHTQVRGGVCVTERGARQQTGEGCDHTQGNRCVPIYRWIVNTCFIRMHTALDCAECVHLCVCQCYMPMSCVLYVRVMATRLLFQQSCLTIQPRFHRRCRW